ncbi:ADP-ribosylglycohydrolase family protein [Kamptonema formosum]|uniref:ADP-ribosylglycohydrolase family protein n=1 Tax=Kamptonema formosum TaxID=331992 RepID=UPI0004780422|nr:ADP-ribosylglycohydrolase family protein [Oscillatoria sp. PCC 10802]
MQSGSKVLSALMGVCVGDALGVPVEFSRRADRIKSPVRGMTGYGTYRQPPGTWSDDSSLTLCLAESLCAGFSLEAIAESFCRWFREADWTPHGDVFDIGNATREALYRLERGVPPLEAGGTGEHSNGNGSLMRILPVAFYHKTLDLSSLIQRAHLVSRITHAHQRSQMACGIYISIAACLLEGLAPKPAYLQGVQNVREIYSQPPYAPELANFKRIFSGKLDELPVSEIKSDGYVISTLEASLWCLLNSASYAEAVLKAVNLGGDTDTTGAVTGGLAGIFYGFDRIPQEWVAQIARIDDIIALSGRLEAALHSS